MCRHARRNPSSAMPSAGGLNAGDMNVSRQWAIASMPVGREHPLASRAHLELADLSDSRWVVYSAGMPMRRLLEREFHEAGLRFPHRLFETTSAFTTLSLLRRQSDLAALLATDVAKVFVDSGLMHILPIQLKSRSEPYQLVTRRGAVLSPAAQLFVQTFPAVAGGR